MSEITEEVRKALNSDEAKYRCECVFADAPTWLRTLLEENERLTKEREETKQKWYTSNKIILKRDEEIVQLRAELDQVKKEQLEYEAWAEARFEEFKEELAEKDKALEWIRDAGTDYQSINKAREVLEMFEKGDTES